MTPTQGQLYIIPVELSEYNDISTCRRVFTEEQECQLSDHIKVLERFYVFSVNQCRELTHECTAQNKPAITVSWMKLRSAE